MSRIPRGSHMTKSVGAEDTFLCSLPKLNPSKGPTLPVASYTSLDPNGLGKSRHCNRGPMPDTWKRTSSRLKSTPPTGVPKAELT